MDISVVIPVYNEHESLPILHEKVTSELTKLGVTYEIIYIDDGSTDGSTEVLKKIQTQDPTVIVAVQRRNFGKSLGLATAFGLAQGETVITMDADLQDEPAELPNLLAKIREGYDVVVGWKKVRHDPISKRLPSAMANSMTRWATGLHLHDMNSGLKAMRLACVRQLNLYGDLHRYIPILAYYEGFKVTEIPVVHHKRQFGRSKYGPGRLLTGGLDLLTVIFLYNYRYRPLHLFGGVGGVLFGLGLFLNMILTFEWFTGLSITGSDRALGERPALILGVLLMLVGLQLLTTGLIAELVVSSIQRSSDPLRMTTQLWRADDKDTLKSR